MIKTTTAPITPATLAIAAAACLPLAPAAMGQEIVALPPVDGFETPVNTYTSGDGMVAAASYFSDAGVYVSFRWDSVEGLGPLLDAAGNAENVRVGGLNDDGGVISGTTGFDVGTTERAVRWLDGPIAEQISSLWAQDLVDVNGDGTVLAGRARFAGTVGNAFRWVEGQGLTDLGTLLGGFSRGLEISVDGRTIVGNESLGGTDSGRGFRWTPDEGLLDIGSLAGDNFAVARSVSGDGAIVFGESWTVPPDRSAGRVNPFRWTEDVGAQPLDLLDGAIGGVVDGASFDGGVAVGTNFFPGDVAIAAVWTADGVQSAADYFADAGVDLTGWTLERVFDISYGGGVIAGRGELDGQLRHFIANLTGAFPLAPTILDQPAGLQVVDAGSRVELSVIIDTGTSPSTFQWQRNGEPLLSGGPYSGVDTSALVIEPVTAAETDTYDVVVTNDAGSVTSDIAVVAVRQPCLADFDGDGSLTLFDFLAFQNAFAAGCP